MEQAESRAKTILLVEDEEPLRSSISGYLTLHGYQVLEAGDAAQALQVASQYQPPIHLLMSDMILPGMNGPELAQRLHERYPRLAVLFTSGYPVEIFPGSVSAHSGFLQKPYPLRTLLARIAELIAAAGT
jgi:DNA-binding response OmpR family regulator